MPVSAILAICIAIFFAGWSVNGWRMDSAQANYQLEIEKEFKRLSDLALEAEKKMQEKVNEIDEKTKDRIEKIVADSHAAADERLREYADELARRAAENSATSGNCEATEAASRLLAELLGEIDRAAEVYAEQADRSRVAGEACSASYQSLLN